MRFYLRRKFSLQTIKRCASSYLGAFVVHHFSPQRQQDTKSCEDDRYKLYGCSGAYYGLNRTMALWSRNVNYG